MDLPDGTSQDTGSTGLSEQDAADRIATLLTPPGDSDGSETPKPPKPKAKAAEPDEDEDPDADEAEGDDADEEESEAEDETEEDPLQPKTYRVKVADEEVEVTEDELLRGYSRTQDYTRKTMELAEARKALEPERQALRQERDQYAELLPRLEAHLQQQWEDPALQELRHTNPAEFLLRRDELQQQAHAVQAERERIEKAQAEETEKERQARRQEEAHKLLKAVPEFQDRKNYEETLGYALNLGFAPEDIQETDNHLAFVVLWKAQQYDQLKAKAPQVRAKAEAVKTAKPGHASASQPSKVTDLTRAKQRLAKTNRVEDAAAVIERMLG